MTHLYWHEAHTIVAIPINYGSRKYKPGKKAILVSVFLSFLLLLSQIFYSLTLSKPPRVSVNTLYQALEPFNELIEPPPCVKNYLGYRKSSQKSDVTCQHLAPPRGFCSLIQELFFERSPETCDHQIDITFCKVVDGSIKCELPLICTDQSIYTGYFDSTEGKTRWKEVSFGKLTEELISISRKRNYEGFIFIKCADSSYNLQHPKNLSFVKLRPEELSDENGSLTQLFLFPVKPSVMLQTKRHANYELGLKSALFFDDSHININLIMIDSLSRDHFYRSLPESISLLDHLKGISATTVLDFQFFQSIKQRTYENLKALFSGFVDTAEKPFGTYEMPPKKLPLNILLSQLKKSGYKTLWLEDMCWTWEWGLAKDLKVVNKSLSNMELWLKFQEALNAAYIDSVDITLASCEILEANGRKDPFHDAPAVCFNGKYHHAYLFEYLRMYQDIHRGRNDHTFTFLQTNVAHDDTGIRVQSLDQSLMNYIQHAATLDNTLTLIFSDHGNTYGEFLRRSPEAYIETFNPFMFFVIPDGVKDKIGDVNLRILSDNQNKLVSLIDIYETLLALTGNNDHGDRPAKFKEKYVISNGLLSNIPSGRTCNDIPIIMPNLCICRDFDTTIAISEVHYALADFSVGVLNNIILTKRVKAGSSGFGNCQLLIVKEIRKVRELRKTSEVINFKLDIEVSGILLPNQAELFFFVVEVSFDIPSIRLISYERISLYSLFRPCQDDEVETPMCICDINKVENNFNKRIFSLFIPNVVSSVDLFKKATHETSEKQIMAFFDVRSPFMETTIDKKYPNEKPCVYVVRHVYKFSFNIYAVNICSTLIKISLTFKSDNILLSDTAVSHHLTHSLAVKHLVSGTKSNTKLESHWSYEISIDSF